jgi:ABC-type nitrate/sulfonate/bicarbonate transport system ATPase subunit
LPLARGSASITSVRDRSFIIDSSRVLLSALPVDVWRETRKTVVYVAQNVAEAVYLADRIVVLTPHPGTVKADVKMALPRPSDLLSVEFFEAQKRVLGELR